MVVPAIMDNKLNQLASSPLPHWERENGSYNPPDRTQKRDNNNNKQREVGLAPAFTSRWTVPPPRPPSVPLASRNSIHARFS